MWSCCRCVETGLLVIAGLAGLGRVADAQPAMQPPAMQPPSTRAPAVAIAPLRTFELRLDGELGEWQGVPAIALDSTAYLLTDPALYAGGADLSGAFRFAWDSLYLYVAARFADDTLVRGAAWTSDRVNLVFDFRNDNNPLSYGGRPADLGSAQPDDQWVYAHAVGDGDPPYPVMRLAADYHGPIAGAELASRQSEGGWALEMRVPWSGLPEARPFVGAVFGLQVFVSDGDGGGGLTEIMWSARWGYSADAGLAWELWRMGRLVLVGQPLGTP